MFCFDELYSTVVRVHQRVGQHCVAGVAELHEHRLLRSIVQLQVLAVVHLVFHALALPHQPPQLAQQLLVLGLAQECLVLDADAAAGAGQGELPVPVELLDDGLHDVAEAVVGHQPCPHLRPVNLQTLYPA